MAVRNIGAARAPLSFSTALPETTRVSCHGAGSMQSSAMRKWHFVCLHRRSLTEQAHQRKYKRNRKVTRHLCGRLRTNPSQKRSLVQAVLGLGGGKEGAMARAV
ncbi:hypothetical protein TWF106_010764 [Orbilia oligospora]|uniref:Uncharacterized protein n=1 Tax=Orbilia oligospora TaxID=2813651 RepID=A0A7C8UHP6_ORBOL|nr:hypothetical protein TWF788_006416 [Orbilia oligospora]KAF3210233.1 hypothetical protein TWF106_010764 [Orbilia oligospora]